MENVKASITFANKKKTLEGIIKSANLQEKDGLYIMIELHNGEWKLLTPKHVVKDITFKPLINESLEALAETQ
jgi:hypothetical protein